MATLFNSRASSSINPTLISYRNGKYQGFIQSLSKLPHGLGMLLTEDYQLVVGFWKNGQLQGQCLIVFPNGSITFGSFTKHLPEKMICFQLANGKVLYYFSSNTKESVCLLDDTLSKTITVVKMNKDIRSEFFDAVNTKRLKTSIDQIKQQKVLFFPNKIQVIQEIRYANEAQKWSKMQECSKQPIKSQYKRYKTFLKLNFCNSAKSQIQMTQTKQQVQLRFKNSSIICKIHEENGKENTLRLKLLGFYDESSRKMQIFRKPVPGTVNQTQELCQDVSFNYTNERPIQVKHKFIKYLMKSTNFANIFIKNQQFEFIRVYYESLCQIIERQTSTKKAQILLQLAQPSRQLTASQRDKYKKQALKNKRNNQIQLEDVFHKISKKRNSNFVHQKSHSPKKFVQNSSIFTKLYYHQPHVQEKENYFSPSRSKGGKYGQTSPSLKQKKYLNHIQKSPKQNNQYQQQQKLVNNEQPSKSKGKKYIYIPDEKHNKSINALDSLKKYNKKQLILDLFHSKSEFLHQQNQDDNFKKYQALGERDKGAGNYYNESIRDLTKDYEFINQKLTVVKQSSNRKDFEAGTYRINKYSYQHIKSPKRADYSKSPAYSPNSHISKGKQQWR